MAGTQTTTKPKPKPGDGGADAPRAWNVVLLNDDGHSVAYVVRMMLELFGHPPEKGLKIAHTVDAEGRAICKTTHKELAELKRDQILAFGRDAAIPECKGSMSAIIEPAEFGGEDDAATGGGGDSGSKGKGT